MTIIYLINCFPNCDSGPSVRVRPVAPFAVSHSLAATFFTNCRRNTQFNNMQGVGGSSPLAFTKKRGYRKDNLFFYCRIQALPSAADLLGGSFVQHSEKAITISLNLRNLFPKALPHCRSG